ITIFLYPFRLIYSFFKFLFGTKSFDEQVDELAQAWVAQQMADWEQEKYCDPSYFFEGVVVILKDYKIMDKEGRNYTISSLRRMVLKSCPEFTKGSDIDCLLNGSKIHESAVQLLANLLGVSFHIFQKGTSEDTHIDIKISPATKGQYSHKWVRLHRMLEPEREWYTLYTDFDRKVYDENNLDENSRRIVEFFRRCETMPQEEFDELQERTVRESYGSFIGPKRSLF
ncbi:MAG: hypothetical protein AB7F64_09655, partial [Gammaproteobacteria bacterium]